MGRIGVISTDTPPKAPKNDKQREAGRSAEWQQCFPALRRQKKRLLGGYEPPGDIRSAVGSAAGVVRVGREVNVITRIQVETDRSRETGRA